MVLIVWFLAIIIVLYGIYKIYICHTHLSSIPKPPCSLIFGHISLLRNAKDSIRNVTKYSIEYGGIIRILIPPSKPSVVVSDPGMLKILMTSEHCITKSLDYRFLKTWLGEGLVTGQGNHWRTHRRMLTPCFGRLTALKHYIHSFESKGDILIEKLRLHVSNPNLDIFPLMKLYTMDVLCETAMGLSLNCQGNSNMEYFKSIEDICKITSSRMRSPLKRYDTYFRFTEDYQIQKQALKVIDSFYLDVVNKKRQKSVVDTNNGIQNGSQKTFLDLLLHFAKFDTKLTERDIQDEINTFMFGGHDTTATGIAYTLYALARHPNIQEKVIDEQKQVFGAEFMNPKVTYTKLQEMKYLDMVINEALRLYPPIPAIGRRITEDLDLGNGIILPKNMNVILLLIALHRNPKYFPNPEKFIPERFDNDNNLTFIHLPFSAGQRSCVGRKFGMLQLKSSLSKILRNFKLFPSNPECELELHNEMILVSKNGIRISIQERCMDN